MKAIIEMPKGDIRRRHLNYEKTGFIDLGLIKDKIPVNDGVMPIAYGYISETLNVDEGDEIDVLVFSDENLKIGQEIEIDPIALLKRTDGDDKIVAAHKERGEVENWESVPKENRELIISFFGCNSPIEVIESRGAALEYVKQGSKNFFGNITQ